MDTLRYHGYITTAIISSTRKKLLGLCSQEHRSCLSVLLANTLAQGHLAGPAPVRTLVGHQLSTQSENVDKMFICESMGTV